MNPHVIWPNRVGPRLALAIAIGSICLIIPHQVARGGDPAAIDWRDDYGAALEESRSTNRLLWIQFTGPWCPNCTRMERDSLGDPSIVDRSRQSFVALKVRSDLNADLAAAFNLTAIPATVIVAPNRDVVSFHQGYLGPDELDGLLREGQARLSTKPVQEQPAAAPQESTARAGETKKDEPKKDKPIADAAIAVSGYCPVSLVEERKLVKGRREHSVVHDGRAYYFTTSAASERFRQEPARYVPWSGGNCPVTQLEQGVTKPGNARWGVLYSGRLFLCASDLDRRKFVVNPDAFADQPVTQARLSDAGGSEVERSR
jgi:YHS domain-containing protein